jgi:hypothetical protein
MLCQCVVDLDRQREPSEAGELIVTPEMEREEKMKREREERERRQRERKEREERVRKTWEDRERYCVTSAYSMHIPWLYVNIAPPLVGWH